MTQLVGRMDNLKRDITSIGFRNRNESGLGFRNPIQSAALGRGDGTAGPIYASAKDIFGRAAG
jgi:hypothetical protein